MLIHVKHLEGDVIKCKLVPKLYPVTFTHVTKVSVTKEIFPSDTNIDLIFLHAKQRGTIKCLVPSS